MKSKKTSRRRTATPAAVDKFKTPNAYLAALSSEKRAALEILRKTIKAAAPEAEDRPGAKTGKASDYEDRWLSPRLEATHATTKKP